MMSLQKNLQMKKDETRRKNISIIFQDNNLLNDFTAIENVMMPLIIKGENETNSKQEAKKFLRLLKFLIGLSIFQTNFLVENNKELLSQEL